MYYLFPITVTPLPLPPTHTHSSSPIPFPPQGLDSHSCTSYLLMEPCSIWTFMTNLAHLRCVWAASALAYFVRSHLGIFHLLVLYFILHLQSPMRAILFSSYRNRGHLFQVRPNRWLLFIFPYQTEGIFILSFWAFLSAVDARVPRPLEGRVLP